MSLTRHFNIQTLAGVFLCIVLVIVSLQAAFGPSRESTLADSQPKEGETCEGEAIKVTYTYAREQLQPHECKVQCEDGRRRYIVYANGMATQCQPPPGCSDWGEDMGITCTPPVASE